MKKILVSFTSIIFIFIYTSITAASTVNIEYMARGDWSPKNPATDGITQFNLEVDIPLDQYKLGFEYVSGTEKYQNDSSVCNWDGYQIDLGYSLIKNDTTNMDLVLIYTSKNIDIDNKLSGFLVGLNTYYKVNQNLQIEVGFGFSNNGEMKYRNNLQKDTDILNYKLRLSYMFNPNIGTSIGYRCDTFEPTGDDQQMIKGITVGLVYQF